MNSSITHIFNQALLTMLRCVEEDAFSWAENPLDSGAGSYDDHNVPRQRLSALVSEFVSLKSVLLLMMPLCEKKWRIDTSAVPRFYDYELHQKGIFPMVIKNKDASIVVDKLPGFPSGVIGKHYSNSEDLLHTLPISASFITTTQRNIAI